MSKHYNFNYTFGDTKGITFSKEYEYTGDLLIYYSSLSEPHHIDCRCSRWDQVDWNITVETWLKKDNVQILLDNTTPGAVGELLDVLGSKTHYDKTWSGENTIKLVPNTRKIFVMSGSISYGTVNSTLRSMRQPTIIYVKNITTSPIEGNRLWMNVKIEGVKSGSHV